MKVITVKKKCPNCRQFTLVKRGYYRTTARPKKRRRWSCKSCGKHFGLRSIILQKFRYKQYDLKILRLIDKLRKEERTLPKKYDGKGNQLYSSRDIAKMVKFKGRPLSKSGVAQIMKSFKEYDEKMEARYQDYGKIYAMENYEKGKRVAKERYHRDKKLSVKDVFIKKWTKMIEKEEDKKDDN